MGEYGGGRGCYTRADNQMCRGITGMGSGGGDDGRVGGGDDGGGGRGTQAQTLKWGTALNGGRGA